MVERYLGKDTPENALHGTWDDKVIDYRFLSLWEETRASSCRTLSGQAMELIQKASDVADTMSVAHFDHRTVLVSQELLLRGDAKFTTLDRISLMSQVPTAVKNLGRFAQALQSTQPLLLSGPSGSGKSLLVQHTAEQLGKLDRMLTLHLNEQSDAKLLVGIYTSGETPGSIIWKPGVLTTAVQDGRWVLIEDIDRAPEHILSALLPLIEHRKLTISNRKQIIHAAEGFRIIATTQVPSSATKPGKVLANMLGRRHWRDIQVDPLALEELAVVVGQRFAELRQLLPQIMAVYERVQALASTPAFLSKSKTSLMRHFGPRELLKWCRRSTQLLKVRNGHTAADMDDIFLEALDCFAGALPEGQAREQILAVIAEELHLDPQRRDYLVTDRDVKFYLEKQRLSIGRYVLDKHDTAKRRQESPFSTNLYTLRMMERIAAAVANRESLLLVGETGVGKTTSVQYLAGQLGKRLIAFNLSQQSEAGDLLGGFKPVNMRSIIIALQDDFETLFNVSFSHSRNQQFLEQLSKYLARSNWKAVCKLWRQALKMVDEQNIKTDQEGEPNAKRRKVATNESARRAQWEVFASKLTNIEGRLASGAEAFAFAFVEGNIVKALRNGDWILLDEINLASSDTLEALSDLLDPEQPSVLLTEAGNVERIVAHPEFRVFAAMNPATDVGKKDLPLGLRSQFTELFVESPDKDLKSLQAIVTSYLRQEMATDPAVALDVSKLYQSIITLAEDNKLVDGAGQKPHFSLRTLTRTLSYAKYIAPQCNLRRALYEGFQMSFMTFLELDSAGLVNPLLEKYLFRKRKEWRNELRKALRKPDVAVPMVLAYPGSKHWIKQGREPLREEVHYIITPFVERNLENLVRAASTRQFPVLIQGPTSSGKTSMIEYLANRTGYKFVRINNHEHTDLQEYLGTYVSTSNGRLEFQEGILVKALREGHWIVLDELNLAPTDVLEALNRLLDDNRELLIPETQEVVRPHEDFMLFATQNPAGLYGGRKTLSRAFRNRFLELHFDDIPINELQEILQKRNPQLPDSRCKLVVDVYQELAVLRQQNRIFEQKSFATLRDLFRWAMRTNDTIEQLAANGFMLLAERVRKPEERIMIKETIEKVMSAGRPRITIDESTLYSKACPEVQLCIARHRASGLVWTKAMLRLYVLVARAIEHNEPVLLVGDTGCGKTTVCQMLADALDKGLHIVNAHQNTETGDLIGSQRPVRNRAHIEAQLRKFLLESSILKDSAFDKSTTTQALSQAYGLALQRLQGPPKAAYTSTTEYANIKALLVRSQALFEWVDGSLIEAMKEGSFFLLDEISLADDSVLERLNSVLESSRTILLAEKGSLDAMVTAQNGFQFLATMNPGGDYGKRELSPALRNRFTEIWVPSISDPADIISIIEDGLCMEAREHSSAMLAFAQWFKQHFDVSTTSGLSIREVLAWRMFINAFAQHGIAPAVVQGAAMVYIDTLGANPAGLTSLTGTDIAASRSECLDHLSALLGYDCHSIYNTNIEVLHGRTSLSVGPFKLHMRNPDVAQQHEFNFAARTTRLNTLRVVRAMQLVKPVLLEGKPGVGKTALVTALARHVGVPLIRINLSEQTDLIDLFGADAPVDGADAGTFAWRDAPFLQAMKAGHWVLLDEMNLASQSILEGLNAVLDHRGKAFIPELGMTFDKHTEFRLFAAQNPHHQGGGRKGLPASFVNRFTVVYADAFESDDLNLLSAQAFPGVSHDLLFKIVSFVQQLENDVSQIKMFGASGSPWEFNLRDITKWLQLLIADDPRTGKYAAGQLQRLFNEAFGAGHELSDLAITISSTAVQVGNSCIPRHPTSASHMAFHETQRGSCDLDALQMLMMCVQKRWPVLLSGPSGCGKSHIITELAALVGAGLEICALSSETDAMDLIGGYEQLDSRSAVLRALDKFDHHLETLVKADAIGSAPTGQLQSIATLRQRLMSFRAGRLSLDELRQNLSQAPLPGIPQLLESIDHAIQMTGLAHFAWVDGILVEAMQQGKWLVLENANLCSPSVLDRLNSLLENQGTLVLNEHVEKDGSPRIVRPHTDFRIFLLTDTKYGELSRAMRNRAVELYLGLEVPEAQNWPLFYESAMQRFRLAGLSGLTSRPECLPFILDHVGIADLALLPRFVEQLKSGLFCIAPSQEALQQASHSPMPEPYLNRLRQLVAEAVSRRHLPADFACVQTVHPLNNQALFQQDKDIFANALQLGLTHDLLTSLSSLSFLVDDSSTRHQELSRLLRVERQIFVVRKSATTDSTSLSLALVAKLIDSFRTSLLQLEASSQLTTKVNGSALHLILDSLSTVLDNAKSPDINEQQLRVGFNVLRKLSLPLYDTIPMQSHLSVLPDAERSDWGAACTQLWLSLKPASSRTRAQYEGRQMLESLVNEFDQTAFRFEQPLDQLVHLQLSLQHALSMIETNAQIDLTTLNTSVRKALEHESDDTMYAIKPHFASTFERLFRDYTIRTETSQALDVTVLQHLKLLASASTLHTRQTHIGQVAAGLPSFGLLWNTLVGVNNTDMQCNMLLADITTAKHVSIRQLTLLHSELNVIGSVLFRSSYIWSIEDTASLDVLLSKIIGILSTVDQRPETISAGNTESNRYLFKIIEYVQNLPHKAPDKLMAARMWMSLSVHFLRRYIATTGIDPAAEILLERQVHQRCHRRLESNLDAMMTVNKSITGRAESLRTRLAQEQLVCLPSGPDDPGVYRPPMSQIPQLSIVLGSLRRAVSAIEGVLDREAVLPLDQSLVTNLAHIRGRLSEEFSAYADLTGPAIYFLDCLVVGQYLAIESSSVSTHNSELGRIIPMENATLASWVVDETFCTGTTSGADHERRVLWLSALAARTPFQPLRNASAALLSRVEEEFGRLYEAWRRELSTDQRQHAAKNSIYRYQGVDDLGSQEALDAQDELFPTFDDSDKGATGENSTQSIPEPRTQRLASQIMVLHHKLFSQQTASCDAILDLLSQYGRSFASTHAGQYHESLPLALVTAAQLQVDVQNKSALSVSSNFYRDPNLAQVERLRLLVDDAVARFTELHQTWPEHAIPKELKIVCDELLSVAFTAPISKFLPLVEKLYGIFNQWQSIASSEYSVANLVDSAAELIVSWRRLELSSWTTLFDDEDRKCQEDAASWWFTAYETIVIATAQLDDATEGAESHLYGLITVLKDFLEACGQGEYATRLQLLRDFTSHISCIYQGQQVSARVVQALSNFTAYYSKYQVAVNERLAQNRKKLSAEIKDVIQLASWKDRNIDSLRQSAKASHKKLFRIVRKYRDGLAAPVAPIIAAGLPALQALTVERVMQTPRVIQHDRHTTPELDIIRCWSSRPKRFQNVTQTQLLMKQKLRRSHQQHTGHERLSAFVQEIDHAAVELRKATPSRKTEDNEALIGHLKNRKRRLLADVLRELRTMGLQHNPSQDVLIQQSTLPAVFTRLPYVDTLIKVGGIEDISHDHFYRLLNLMPQVRESGRKHSDDLTSAEIARCTALLESILDVAILQYQRISIVQEHITQLVSQVAIVSSFANSTPSLVEDCPVRRSALPAHACGITVVRTCVKMIQMHGGLTGTDTAEVMQHFTGLVDEAESVVSELLSSPALPMGIDDRFQQDKMRSLAPTYQRLHTMVDQTVAECPELTYLMVHMKSWLTVGDLGVDSSDKPNEVDAEAWTSSFMSLLDDILVATEQSEAPMDKHTDESMWLRKAQAALDAKWQVLCNGRILSRLNDLLGQLPTIADPSQTLPALATVCQSTLPLLSAWVDSVQDLGIAYWTLHSETSRLGHVLAAYFIKLSKEGFCAPSDRESEQQGQTGEADAGTGLGDGQGAEDISKDIKDNEDLSELAQEPSKEQDVTDLKNEKDAVDMADEEMEGQTQDADPDSDGSEKSNDDEQGQDDMEEEVGSVNDDTANALDEKMWDDGKVEDQQDKEGSKSKGTKEDDLTAADDGTKPEDNQPELDGVNNEEIQEDEEEGVSEHGDNVDRTDVEGMDNHPQEQENLELPDDMNMDGQSVAENDTPSPNNDFEDTSENADNDNADEVNLDAPEEEPADHEENTSTNEAGEEAEDPEEAPEKDDGMLQDNQKDNADEERAAGEVAGEQGSGQDQNLEQLKPTAGSTEAENDGNAEQSEAHQAASAGEGDTNTAESDTQQGKTETPAARQASSQLKQLGDVLEKFFRQNRAIESAQEAEEHMNESQQADQDLTTAQFEHLRDENESSDAQAVGTGSMEQSKALPEENSIPVDDQKPAEQFPMPEEEEAPDVDMEEAQNPGDRQLQPDVDSRTLQGPRAFVGEQRAYDNDIEMEDAEDDLDDVNNMDLQLSNTHISNEERQKGLSIAEARQLWSQHEGNTRNLALMLTEHLRLILQPTQATKMRGDFRTGKRLNIKKIIPYIASSYKRDKIWMRRTTPTKRNYQIMLAIDDSKSMAENDSKDLAFATLAMVAKSLSMLEAGELCVLSFGEDTTVAHDFSTPFTSDAGPEIFKSFTFDQGKTNVRKMLSKSIDMFGEARLRATGSASELWQLQIIISDGQCEDHPGIRQLVRRAQEERIMIVFVVVDAGYEGDDQETKKSILDLPTAEFVKDENGEMQLKMSKYFDTFPFKYYLIVRDVLELPGVLAGALRQWFAEVVDTGS
ncbi:hypothetical protein AMS68_005872 [Peltaster fructicola]|uniref:Midasin n=1 Tax=Peltaster fructicola TaxID=286661 RepID=A0A6H0Y0B5_9PEZI|nr:hypothetical protein AMS68_005872 [Peltaster fructicola]